MYRMRGKRKPKSKPVGERQRPIDTRIPGAKDAVHDDYTGNPVLDPLRRMGQRRREQALYALWSQPWY